MRLLAFGALAFALAIGLIGQIDSVGSEPCFDGSTTPVTNTEPEPDGELTDLATELVATGLDQPSDMFTLPGHDELFVVEKPGRIVTVASGQISDRPFLDMTTLVEDEANEQGLLSAVPHPDFADNCLLYLFYTDVREDSHLAVASVSGVDEPVVNLTTLTTVLEIPQIRPWHQSGSMVFGPDGYLWVTIGDGGGNGDPEEHGQNLDTLEATVIRIDVDGDSYTIPESNPFASGDGGRAEIWAYGVRNPWRMTIDEGLVYVPDVGHLENEEINIVPIDSAGLNFGWSVMEGSECFEATTCDREGLTLPMFEYEHEGNGCAIVGGSVYRGAAIPELDGHYFYADFCFGWIRSFPVDGGRPGPEERWDRIFEDRLITSFAADADGELYVMNLDGNLWRIVPVRNRS